MLFVRSGIDVLITFTKFLYFLYVYSSVIELTSESTYEQTTKLELGTWLPEFMQTLKQCMNQDSLL